MQDGNKKMALSFQDKIKPVATSSLSFQDKIKPVQKLGQLSAPEEQSGLTRAASATGNFILGALKGAGSTIEGLDQLTRKIPGIKQVQETFNPRTKEDIEFAKELTTAKGTAQKAGKFTEQVAEFVAPVGIIGKLGKGAETLLRGAKLGERAVKLGTLGARAGLEGISAGGVTAVQTGGDLGEAKKTALVGATLPFVGAGLKPVGSLLKRLFKGFGTSLSGMSAGQLEAILKDPKTSQQFVKQIDLAGSGNKLLREEANKIVSGVSAIRQNARKAFGEGLEAIDDIPKGKLSEGLESFVKKAGISSKNGNLILKNVEFDSPKNILKAKEILNKVNDQSDFSGKAIRKLLDDVESAAYKTTGGEAERLSFNAFINDLSKSIRKTISENSPGLNKINSEFSQKMQLVEGIESIFGKVNFKNEKEVLNVSKKLEGLFNQKGLSAEVVDEFLTTIGESPSTFRAGEAVRQIENLTERANSIGTNPFELFRSITSAIVPPKTVRNIAIITGLSENVVKELSEKLSPTLKGALFKTILLNE